MSFFPHKSHYRSMELEQGEGREGRGDRKGKKGEVRHREKEREREILCRVGSKYMLSALRKAHRLKLWDPGVSAPAPLEET